MDFGTARNQTVWQPEPLGRGTYGLLSSCLITMVLCVWTAVHLNIPEHRSHNIKYLPPFQTGRKILWLLVGLFAPEVVSWTAFEQRREAHALHEKIREALCEKTPHPKSGGFSRWLRWAWKGGKEAEKEDVEKSASDGHDTGDSNVLRAPEEENGIASERRTQPASTASTTMGTTKRMNEWTITHSHYAIMGGFAFDSDIIGDGCLVLPGGRKRVTLTGLGILKLIEATPHLLPDISAGQIRDKSKANELAKTIVTLQASWFVAQCISRMALGFTVSMLELNTFAHAICALIAYFLWWQKPLDIEEPTLISGRDADIVCAGMLLRSDLGTLFPAIAAGQRCQRRLVYHTLEDRDPPGSLYQGTKWVPDYGISGYLAHHTDDPDPDREQRRLLFEIHSPPEDLEGSIFKLYMGQSLFGFDFRRKRRAGSQEKEGILGVHREFVELSAADFLYLGRAKQCYATYPSLSRGGFDEGKWWVRDHAPNFPLSRSSLLDATTQTMVFSLFVAGLAYGGIHLLAWDPPVRTWAEALMWRISGIYIIGYGAIPQLIWCSSRLYKLVLTFGQEREPGPKFSVISATSWIILAARFAHILGRLLYMIDDMSDIIIPIMTLLATAATILYVLGRIYLVVECFISLGRLPASVFETPVWTNYLPHLG